MSFLVGTAHEHFIVCMLDCNGTWSFGVWGASPSPPLKHTRPNPVNSKFQNQDLCRIKDSKTKSQAYLQILCEDPHPPPCGNILAYMQVVKTKPG